MAYWRCYQLKMFCTYNNEICTLKFIWTLCKSLCSNFPVLFSWFLKPGLIQHVYLAWMGHKIFIYSSAFRLETLTLYYIALIILQAKHTVYGIFLFFVSILSIQTAGIENTAQADDKEKLLLYFIIALLLLILLNLSCFIHSN